MPRGNYAREVGSQRQAGPRSAPERGAIPVAGEISPGTKARVDPTSTQEQHHLRWLTLSGESRFIRLRSLSASRFPYATRIGSMPRNRLSSSSTLLLMMARTSVMRFKRVAYMRRVKGEVPQAERRESLLDVAGFDPRPTYIRFGS